jgi:hypothetical protein
VPSLVHQMYGRTHFSKAPKHRLVRVIAKNRPILGDRSIDCSQSGPFRVRIEAQRCGWRQYNLRDDCCRTNEASSGVRNRENEIPIQKRCTRPLGYLPPAGVRDRNWRREIWEAAAPRLVARVFSGIAIYRQVGTFTPGTKR